MTNISIVAIGWWTFIVIQIFQFVSTKVLESQMIFLALRDLHNDALHKTDQTKIIDVTIFAWMKVLGSVKLVMYIEHVLFLWVILKALYEIFCPLSTIQRLLTIKLFKF